MGPCCPFLTGNGGNAPYFLLAFIIFSVFALIKAIKLLSKIIQLLEKK